MKSTKQGKIGASKAPRREPNETSKTSLLSSDNKKDSSNGSSALTSTYKLFPAPEEQLEGISKLLKAPLAKGEKWNLVAADWFHGWESLTGYQDENDIAKVKSSSKKEKKHTHLGPIDNSELLDENGELRQNLVEGLDFKLVPSEAWVKLVDWFGVEDKGYVIEREVILIAGEKELEVEIYETYINAFLRYKRDDVRKVSISKSKKIVNLKDKVRAAFDIPEQLDIRIYVKKDIYQAMNDFKFHISELTDGEQIMVESQTEKKKWPTTLTQTNTASSL